MLNSPSHRKSLLLLSNICSVIILLFGVIHHVDNVCYLHSAYLYIDTVIFTYWYIIVSNDKDSSMWLRLSSISRILGSKSLPVHKHLYSLRTYLCLVYNRSIAISLKHDLQNQSWVKSGYRWIAEETERCDLNLLGSMRKMETTNASRQTKLLTSGMLFDKLTFQYETEQLAANSRITNIDQGEKDEKKYQQIETSHVLDILKWNKVITMLSTIRHVLCRYNENREAVDTPPNPLTKADWWI